MVRPIKPEGAPVAPYRPLTAKDRAAVIEACAAHYTLSAATRAAFGDDSRYSAVVAAAKNDPEFGLAIEHAREHARDNLRARIHELTDFEKPLVFQGVPTGFKTEHNYDIEAVKMIARMRLPEFLDKKSEQTVTGSISIAEHGADSRWVLSRDDLSLLDADEKRAVLSALKKVRAAKYAAIVAEREVPAIEDHTAIDAEFSEVPSDDDYSLAEVAALA